MVNSMDDLISRQAALDLFEDAALEIFEYQVREMISELQPAQQWIPCSEELPEEGIPVLGTFKGQGGNFCLTTERMIINGKEQWGASCGLKPIAWMSLPEPYKGDV